MADEDLNQPAAPEAPAPAPAAPELTAPEPERSLRETITAARDQVKAKAEPEGEKTAGERQRDEQGRFAPKAEDGTKPAAETAPKPVDPPTPQAEPQATTQTTPAPPHGWSAEARAQFTKLPAEVQQAVAKREAEVSQGFARLAEYKPLDGFINMARQSGVAPHELVGKYVEADQALQKDPAAGTLFIWQNMGADPLTMVRELARRIGVGNPNGVPQPPQFPPEVAELTRTVQSLQQREEQRQQEARQQAVEQFFSDPAHKHADAVAELMADMIRKDPSLQTPSRLKDVYDRACWLHPEVREQLINERAPSLPASDAAKAAATAAKAKAAAKTVTGAPSPGYTPTAPGASDLSLRDTIRAAAEAARGRA